MHLPVCEDTHTRVYMEQRKLSTVLLITVQLIPLRQGLSLKLKRGCSQQALAITVSILPHHGTEVTGLCGHTLIFASMLGI